MAAGLQDRRSREHIMPNRFLTARACVIAILCCASLQGQELPLDHKERVDAAIPRTAPAKPKQPRRMLVTNLSMRDGTPVRGSSAAAVPPGNYAIQQMGKVTGAYEAVFNNDIEMFRPANIKQFDAICFNNTLGVLFDDPELRASLLGFVENGKGFVGIHDAIATFVQYPKYDGPGAPYFAGPPEGFGLPNELDPAARHGTRVLHRPGPQCRRLLELPDASAHTGRHPVRAW
jgi:hypothetical protein